MIPPLDVFSMKNNVALWLGAVESLLDAFKMGRNHGAGLYLVMSHQTGNKTMFEVDSFGEIRRVDSASSTAGT